MSRPGFRFWFAPYKVCQCIAACALAGTALFHAAAAAPTEQRSAWFPDKMFVQAGAADEAHTLVVGGTWQWPWMREFAFGNASGYFEASFGRWNSHIDDSVHSSAWVTQVGLTPVLRWYLVGSNPRLFAEVGIGLNLLLPIYRSGDRQFSTVFNFGDHVALGMQFGEGGGQEVSLRLQHFSNAGIKQPNPGENFVQLRYAAHF